MAKQKGIFPRNGTYEGINYYTRKGVPLSRKAGGGFTRESIKNNPNMKGVRQNNSEFGAVSSLKKVFWGALAPLFDGHKDGERHGRLMQLFLNIKNEDTVSPEGKRSVDEGLKTEEGQNLLNNFKFTPKSAITSFLGSGVKYEPDAYTLQLPDFNPASVVLPTGATHFSIDYAVLVFNFETGAWELFPGEGIFFDKAMPSQTLVLKPREFPYGSGMPLAFVVVRCFQEAKGTYYELFNEKWFGVVLRCEY